MWTCGYVAKRKGIKNYYEEIRKKGKLKGEREARKPPYCVMKTFYRFCRLMFLFQRKGTAIYQFIRLATFQRFFSPINNLCILMEEVLFLLATLQVNQCSCYIEDSFFNWSLVNGITHRF